MLPIRIFCPGIKLPIGDGNLAFTILDEDRAGVARPNTIGAEGIGLDLSQVDAGKAQGMPGFLIGPVALNQQSDLLASMEMPNDFDENPGNCTKLARPIIAVMRPSHP